MHYAIVGNGVAGINAAFKIRARDTSAEISIISDETDFHYSRTALMWGYTGQLSPRDMEPYERRIWKEMNFRLVRDFVERIEPEAKVLRLRKAGRLPYDKLLLATGAKANMFGWPGQELSGVGNFTSMQHLEALLAQKERIKKAVIVGGGLIGIELVEIMLETGVDTTYILREPWYWQKMLDRREGGIVERLIKEHGGRVILENEIGNIEGRDGRVSELVTKKGQRLACDFVGIAVGVHPNTDLCTGTKIATGKGILTNPSMRTSVPDIYAAGDCAEIRYPGQDTGVIEQLWYTGIDQGKTAGRAMLGDDVSYRRGIPYNAAQFLFYDFVTVGQMRQLSPELTESFEQGKWNGKDWTCRISHVRNEVRGFAMLGARWDCTVLMGWIRERRAPDWCVSRLSDAVFNEEFTALELGGALR